MSRPLIVIPARYGSTRFPGKPLAIIAGKTMIQRVYEQCLQVPDCEVIVATDNLEIKQTVEQFGGKAVLTKDHPSGTDRVAEVAEMFPEARLIVNVQGDEPCLHPAQISQVITLLENGAEIATLKKEISQAMAENPNTVKVVTSLTAKALYFSRSVIPFVRDKADKYYKHIGIYGFQRSVLLAVCKLPQGQLEQTEGLEQLRWLANDYAIFCGITTEESPSVDVPADIQKVEAYLGK